MLWLSEIETVGRMPNYGAQHFAVLASIAVAAIVLVWAARRVSGTPVEGRALTIAGWIMLAATIVWVVWNLVPSHWHIEKSLPLNLSDALRFITSFALITRSGWLIAICYYWGLTLNIQSILTPDLNYFHAPVFEFIMYWFFHGMALLTPIVLVWGFGYRPTWRGYGIAYASVLFWAGLAGIVNALTGANYLYLAHAPEIASALDLLGPWPWYILSEIILIAAVWALITWPWAGRRAREIPVVDRLGAVRRRVPAGRASA